jgi:chorismate mutase
MRNELALPFTVEVAEPKHVEAALKAGTDVLWLGARTTVNPFQVQQIADAIKGTNIPVMVKNPVNPDVDLWEGAIERIQRAGASEVVAIHRGFSSYQPSSVYRNQPNWPIPIELKRRRPDLFIVCDPSHITGNRTLVKDVAQKAMALCFDGLMIEVHPTPEKAWTDAAQQITPQTLQEILCELIVRKHAVENGIHGTQIENLRQQMDTIDAEIIYLLARRMDLSDQMGLLKKEQNMTVYNPERWREIVETRSEQAMKQNLSPEFILALYEKIHHESIQRQLKQLEQPQ